jgi:hypothetical protein
MTDSARALPREGPGALDAEAPFHPPGGQGEGEEESV